MGRASLLLILYIFTGTVGVLCKRPIRKACYCKTLSRNLYSIHKKIKKQKKM